MTLLDVLKSLGLGEVRSAAEQLLLQLPEDAPQDWRILAVALALRSQQRGVRVLGISGGQGAGKSTLARLVEQVNGLLGRSCANLSLDDFYLTQAERAQLAQQQHPLLATRGVPGTHDVALAESVIRGLLSDEQQSVPRFDKARDDRCADFDKVAGPVDLVILEGWCVGATAQPAVALQVFCNDLERTEDPHGHWRGYVNECLQSDYRRLWSLIDDLLFLAVPDIDAVVRWRGQQEQERPEAARMTEPDLLRFVAHYDRLTKWMIASMPGKADMVGILDRDHKLTALFTKP